MPRIPVGDVLEAIVQWLTTHAGALFDTIATVLLALVDAVYIALASPIQYVLIAILALIAAAATRRAGMVVFTVVAFLLVDGMDLWTDMLQTLAVVLVAATIAVAIGVPVGIAGATNTRTSRILRPLLDFMQTLPVFVYLVPAVFFFGIGVVPGVVATTVFAIPPAVRLTELGIRQVDPETVEAAHAFGAQPAQILREVQIPLATRSIMAGVNQVIMLALSMVVVAGLVGAEGLGMSVIQGVTQLNIGAAFEGGIAVVILAIYLDRITNALGAPRKRLRGRARATGATADTDSETQAEPERQPAEARSA